MDCFCITSNDARLGKELFETDKLLWWKNLRECTDERLNLIVTYATSLATRAHTET